MRILVVDQCSGSKSYPDGSPSLTLADLDGRSREELLAEDGVAARKARRLYDGRQQERIDGAVDALRDAGHDVDRYFVSAGFGLVEETELLPPYDVTFQEFSDEEISERAESLGLPEAVSDLLASDPPYDIAFLALGRDYYTAIGYPDVLDGFSGGTVVVFNSAEVAATRSHVVSLPARTEEARTRGVIVVELKGKYLQNLTEVLREEGAVRSDDRIQQACLEGTGEQTNVEDFR